MNQPLVTGGHLVAQLEFERHVAGLWTDLNSPGPVEYRHLLAVQPRAGGEPVLFVTAEISAGGRRIAERLRIPSGYFLCAFVGGEHRNYGASTELEDLQQFEAAACRLAEQLLGDRQIPRDDDRGAGGLGPPPEST